MSNQTTVNAIEIGKMRLPEGIGLSDLVEGSDLNISGDTEYVTSVRDQGFVTARRLPGGFPIIRVTEYEIKLDENGQYLVVNDSHRITEHGLSLPNIGREDISSIYNYHTSKLREFGK